MYSCKFHGPREVLHTEIKRGPQCRRQRTSGEAPPRVQTGNSRPSNDFLIATIHNVMTKESIRAAMLNLHQRPIAYYPVYRRITGSTPGGILLSQLMYWFAAVGGREFHKTDEEIMDETGLTANELRGGKSKLKKLPFCRIRLKGVPPKTRYWIDLHSLFREIHEIDLVKSNKLISSNPGNQISEIQQNITENTTENTTENFLSKDTPVGGKNKIDFSADAWIKTRDYMIKKIQEERIYLQMMEGAARANNWQGSEEERNEIIGDYLRNLQEDGKFFEIQVPRSENEEVRFWGKILPGIGRYMKASVRRKKGGINKNGKNQNHGRKNGKIISDDIYAKARAERGIR